MGDMGNEFHYKLSTLSVKPGEIVVMELDTEFMTTKRRAEAFAQAAQEALDAKKAGVLPGDSYVWVVPSFTRVYRKKSWLFFPRWAISTYFRILFKTRVINVED